MSFQSSVRHWLGTAAVTRSLVLLFALAVRLPILSKVRHPGHADSAYYFSLAQSLSEGRGFTIDYVWHFLTPHAGLTHYANDYWMPLPAVVMALFMLVGGATPLVGVLANVVLSAVTAVVVAWALDEELGRRDATLAGLLVAVAPFYFGMSLQTESTVSAALALFGAYVLGARSESTHADVGTGVCLGVAVSCRQDALLALPGLLYLLRPQDRPPLWQRPVLLGIGTSIPLLVVVALNLSHGAPAWPKGGQALFAVRYEDVLAVGGPDPARLLSLSWLELCGRTLRAFWENCRVWGTETRYWGWPMLAILLLRARHERLSRAVAVQFGAALAVYSLFGPLGVGGSFLRTTSALVPTLLFCITGELQRLGRWCLPVGSALCVLFLVQGVGKGRALVERNNRIGDEAASLGQLILGAHGPGAVVMTRSPWELVRPGLRAVQIPEGPEATVLSIACSYRVTHFIEPADATLRPGLRALLEHSQAPLIGSLAGQRIYAARSSCAAEPN